MTDGIAIWIRVKLTDLFCNFQRITNYLTDFYFFECIKLLTKKRECKEHSSDLWHKLEQMCNDPFLNIEHKVFSERKENKKLLFSIETKI